MIKANIDFKKELERTVEVDDNIVMLKVKDGNTVKYVDGFIGDMTDNEVELCPAHGEDSFTNFKNILQMKMLPNNVKSSDFVAKDFMESRDVYQSTLNIFLGKNF